MRSVSVTASLLALPLEHALTIARGTSTESRTVLVRVACEGAEGIGECAPIPRYHETVESVLDLYAAKMAKPIEVRDFDGVLDLVPQAARCGLDIALHDLLGKRLGAPLWEIFGLDPARVPLTSFTIYIDEVATMVEEAKRYRSAPILKVKLGLGSELETIESIRSVYSGTIRIDANEGWSAEESVALLGQMERYDIEFCEQPIPAGKPEQLGWIRERVRIPIVADEDSVTASDLPSLIGRVDGVNVKLSKCGGIRAAHAMIHTARALGFKIMLGCMTESSILITAAGHLAPLVDWADLDGNLMLAREPFVGMTHNSGRLTLPDSPGLGIVETVAV
jgi:L-alanine-DL-glutamate epimerase-like enolase superfamily enzyme